MQYFKSYEEAKKIAYIRETLKKDISTGDRTLPKTLMEVVPGDGQYFESLLYDMVPECRKTEGVMLYTYPN